MLISYILLCKCCFQIVRKLLFLQLQPLCCPCHSRFLHNLMHLQNSSLHFGCISRRILRWHARQFSRDCCRFCSRNLYCFICNSSSHSRCLLARRTTLTIVLGYFTTLTYLLWPLVNHGHPLGSYPEIQPLKPCLPTGA